MNRRRIFALDLRSLALFRMLLGVLLLADLIARWAGLREPVYAGSGLLHVVIPTLAAVAAVLLVAGWRSRAAAFCCWVLLAYLHGGSGVTATTGDRFLLMLLFWAWLLPVGARYSLDLRLRVRTREDHSFYASPATAGLIVQVFLFFFCAALAHAAGAGGNPGSPLRSALAHPETLNSLGVWLLQKDSVLPVLNISVLLLMGAGAFLLLLRHEKTRTGTIGLLALSLAALTLALPLGLLPFAAAAGLVALLPPRFWKRVGAARKRLRNRHFRINAPIVPDILQVPPPSHELPSAASVRAERCRGLLAAVALGLIILANLNDHSGFLNQSALYRDLQQGLAFEQNWTLLPQSGNPATAAPELIAAPPSD